MTTVTIIYHFDELTLVQLSSNPRHFLSLNKLMDDDDLTLNVLDVSEASKIKTRKVKVVLKSTHQVDR